MDYIKKVLLNYLKLLATPVDVRYVLFSLRVSVFVYLKGEHREVV